MCQCGIALPIVTRVPARRPREVQSTAQLSCPAEPVETLSLVVKPRVKGPARPAPSGPGEGNNIYIRALVRPSPMDLGTCEILQ